MPSKRLGPLGTTYLRFSAGNYVKHKRATITRFQSELSLPIPSSYRPRPPNPWEFLPVSLASYRLGRLLWPWTQSYLAVACKYDAQTLNPSTHSFQRSLLQTLCVLGYCIFPLVISALISTFIRILWVRAPISLAAWAWSVWGRLRAHPSGSFSDWLFFPYASFNKFLGWIKNWPAASTARSIPNIVRLQMIILAADWTFRTSLFYFILAWMILIQWGSYSPSRLLCADFLSLNNARSLEWSSSTIGSDIILSSCGPLGISPITIAKHCIRLLFLHRGRLPIHLLSSTTVQSWNQVHPCGTPLSVYSMTRWGKSILVPMLRRIGIRPTLALVYDMRGNTFQHKALVSAALVIGGKGLGNVPRITDAESPWPYCEWDGKFPYFVIQKCCPGSMWYERMLDKDMKD